MSLPPVFERKTKMLRRKSVPWKHKFYKTSKLSSTFFNALGCYRDSRRTAWWRPKRRPASCPSRRRWRGSARTRTRCRGSSRTDSAKKEGELNEEWVYLTSNNTLYSSTLDLSEKCNVAMKVWTYLLKRPSLKQKTINQVTTNQQINLSINLTCRGSERGT